MFLKLCIWVGYSTDDLTSDSQGITINMILAIRMGMDQVGKMLGNVRKEAFPFYQFHISQRGMSVRATALSPFCHFSHCSPQETSDLTAGRLVGQEAGHTLQTCKSILYSFSPGAPQQVVGFWVPTKSSSANPWRKPFLNPQMTQLYLLLYFGSLFIFIDFVLLYNNLYTYVLASSALLTATQGTLSLTLCIYAVGCVAHHHAM